MQTPGSILLHLDSSARTQERIALARQLARSLWATLRTPNRTLWGVLGLASALLLAALYVPWAVAVLRFAPLPVHELAAACGLGLLSVLWFEGIQWARRRTSR